MAADRINWSTMERRANEEPSAPSGLKPAPQVVTQEPGPAEGSPAAPAPAPSLAPPPSASVAYLCPPATVPPPVSPAPVEWVCCESCERWHILPASVPASTLPDLWYCKDNTWDPSQAVFYVKQQVVYKDDLEGEGDDELVEDDNDNDDDEDYIDKNYRRKKKQKKAD